MILYSSVLWGIFNISPQGLEHPLLDAYKDIAQGTCYFLIGVLYLFGFFFEELDGTIYKREEYGTAREFLIGFFAVLIGGSEIIRETIEVIQYLF